MKNLYCAKCGKEIKTNEEYYFVGDNYLQAKYFDAPDGSDNIFCSKDCLCKALTVMSGTVGGKDTDITCIQEVEFGEMKYSVGETVYFNYDDMKMRGEIEKVDYEEKKYYVYASAISEETEIEDWFSQQEIEEN